MLLTLLFWTSLSVPGVTYGGNTIQTDKRTKVDLIKSLIYDNTKATVTLDSSALKQLIHLSSGTSTPLRRVSFSVTVNLNQIIKLKNGQIVKYNKILTNDGNGYDVRTGVFTCPVAGSYMFVVDSMSQPGTWLYLKVNKNTVGKMYWYVSVDHKDNPLIQVSKTVIVKLKAGDHVKVENDGHSGKMYYDMYSGFTGVLLY
ncbi:C1q-related factor-like [Crassostrea angulata]|uniref:C1q-related factor-like n=1 Tax=Magallana angulata TaxID=2784310 RepID=UPI0022B20B74|nr:C1q-related factor-like [Crassostrea angulata]